LGPKHAEKRAWIGLYPVPVSRQKPPGGVEKGGLDVSFAKQDLGRTCYSGRRRARNRGGAGGEPQPFWEGPSTPPGLSASWSAPANWKKKKKKQKQGGVFRGAGHRPLSRPPCTDWRELAAFFLLRKNLGGPPQFGGDGGLSTPFLSPPKFTLGADGAFVGCGGTEKDTCAIARRRGGGAWGGAGAGGWVLRWPDNGVLRAPLSGEDGGKGRVVFHYCGHLKTLGRGHFSGCGVSQKFKAGGGGPPRSFTGE